MDVIEDTEGLLMIALLGALGLGAWYLFNKWKNAPNDPWSYRNFDDYGLVNPVDAIFNPTESMPSGFDQGAATGGGFGGGGGEAF